MSYTVSVFTFVFISIGDFDYCVVIVVQMSGSWKEGGSWMATSK